MLNRKVIGSTELSTSSNYWSGGKPANQLRVNENELYAQIDLLQSKASIATTENQIQSLYNEMDLLYVTLQLIEKFGNDIEALTGVSIPFSLAVQNGSFNKYYESLDARNAAVDSLINEIVTSSVEFAHVPDEFNAWWTSTIVEQNYYCNPSTGEKGQTPFEATSQKIGAYDSNYYSAKLKETGPYWLYSQTNETLSLAAKMKQSKHIQYLDWAASANLGLNRASIDANVQSGIITKFGKPATDVVKDLKTSSISGARIGDGGITATIAIIIAVITLVSAVVKAIVEIVDAFHKDNAPTESEIQSNAPAETDWFNYTDTDGTITEDSGSYTENSNSKLLLWLAIGLGAVLLFS